MSSTILSLNSPLAARGAFAFAKAATSTYFPSPCLLQRQQQNSRFVPLRNMTIVAKHKNKSADADAKAKSEKESKHENINKISGVDVFVDDKTDTIYTKNTFPHPKFDKDFMESVRITHRDPRTFRDRYALWLVRLLRFGFDLFTGYRHPELKFSPDGRAVVDKRDYQLTPEKWMSRFIFLESIAGVPGMVGAFLRHLHSLRLLQRDKAWIETLCDEAYNERMHLLTFIKIGKPGIFTRAFLYVAQGVFANMFFLSYMFTPKTCHRFVGYLEEEAVITYSHCIQDIDAGLLPDLADIQVPDIALAYWNMKPDASFRDLILYVRADEAKHREVNHTLANLKQKQDRNPYAFNADKSRPQPVNDFKYTKPEGWERNEIAKVCEKRRE